MPFLSCFFKMLQVSHLQHFLCKNSSKMPILAAVDGARLVSLRLFLHLPGLFGDDFRVFRHLLLEMPLLW